jgi:phosphoribosylformylglycinamidine cyclo-ligase
MDLIDSPVDVRGLAHITSGGLDNLLRLEADVGYEIDSPLKVPEIFALIQERAEVPDQEMHDVFNMGCGFCAVVPESDVRAAMELIAVHHPAPGQIGVVTADEGNVVRA